MEYQKYIVQNEKYQHFLFCSATLFILPCITAFMMKKYHEAILITIVLITSILRWGYRENKWFQMIDHNYVKYYFFHCIYIFVTTLHTNDASIFLLFLSINGAFCYLIGVLLHVMGSSIKNNIFHMLMHMQLIIGHIGFSLFL